MRHLSSLTSLLLTSSLALAALAACGDDAPSDPPRTLCDGSSGLRLAVQTIVRPDGLEGTQVLYDNGADFLFVGGDCQYYVQPGDSITAEVHAGVLDAATAAELAADLHYDAWPRLTRTRHGQTADAPAPLTLHDGANVFDCYNNCSDDQDVELRYLPSRAHTWMTRLWEEGGAVSTPVRIMVVAQDFPDSDPAVTWPLATPLADLAFPPGTSLGLGEGVLFDEDDASALRAVRAPNREGAIGTVVEDASVRYWLYLRDTTPFEDASGLVPVPPFFGK
jgi:hypothetical protein